MHQARCCARSTPLRDGPSYLPLFCWSTERELNPRILVLQFGIPVYFQLLSRTTPPSKALKNTAWNFSQWCENGVIPLLAGSHSKDSSPCKAAGPTPHDLPRPTNFEELRRAKERLQQ